MNLYTMGKEDSCRRTTEVPENIVVSPVENSVATITLNRPQKKNALSIALRDEVTQALNNFAQDTNVKVVVITGSADIFSAGFDLSEFQRAGGDEEFSKTLWASSDAFHRRCITFPLPLIAAVNGAAIAGGFDLATMCDIRIGCPETYFSHPEIAFGDVIYSLLHDLCGGGVARELCLTGRRIDATEALSIRLLSSVVERSEFEQEIARITGMITQAPREFLLNTKAKIIRRLGVESRATLEL